MKTLFFKILFSITLIIPLFNSVKAQLSFPAGSTLNLNTTNDFLYIETRILFHTGTFRSDDYQWEKISDSIQINWLIGACFNGDCRNDLLQSGNFIRDFGLNDTTCFIAFHVETYGYNGTSVIKYKVYNKHNNLDSADLIFNITYANPTGVNEIMPNDFFIYPGLAVSDITLRSNTDLQNAEIKIVNMLGETQSQNIISVARNNKADFNVSGLSRGIYFIQIKSNDKFFIQKFIKE